MTFELNTDLAKDLPPPVATILQEFVATLAATMTLESVILFGSAAEGRLRSTSDVNLSSSMPCACRCVRAAPLPA
jgi:hypothetical protein